MHSYSPIVLVGFQFQIFGHTIKNMIILINYLDLIMFTNWYEKHSEDIKLENFETKSFTKKKFGDVTSVRIAFVRTTWNH